VVDAKVTQFQVTGLSLDASVLIGAKDGAVFCRRRWSGMTRSPGEPALIISWASRATTPSTAATGPGHDGRRRDNDTYVIDNVLDHIVEDNNAGTRHGEDRRAWCCGNNQRRELHFHRQRANLALHWQHARQRDHRGAGKDELDGGTGNEHAAGRRRTTSSPRCRHDTLDGGKATISFRRGWHRHLLSSTA